MGYKGNSENGSVRCKSHNSAVWHFSTLPAGEKNLIGVKETGTLQCISASVHTT